MSDNIIASRYALALYDLAVKAKAVGSVWSDLQALSGLMTEHAGLRQVMMTPAFSARHKATPETILAAILKAGGAHKLTRQFMGVIAQNGRLSLLPDMTRAYDAEKAHREGRISAAVTSAIPLETSQADAIKKTIATLAQKDLGPENPDGNGSKTIDMTMRVDPTLIGGLIVRIGSKLFDTSVRTKLNRLEVTMKGGD